MITHSVEQVQSGTQLVDKAGLAELWKPQPQQDGTYRAFNSTVNGYGLGWPSARRAAHPAVTPVGGARAAIFIYPNDDLTVVVLTNLMGASPEKFVDKIASSYIPDLAAATRVWRRMFPSEEYLAKNGLKFMKSSWEGRT